MTMGEELLGLLEYRILSFEMLHYGLKGYPASMKSSMTSLRFRIKLLEANTF